MSFDSSRPSQHLPPTPLEVLSMEHPGLETSTSFSHGDPVATSAAQTKIKIKEAVQLAKKVDLEGWLFGQNTTPSKKTSINTSTNNDTADAPPRHLPKTTSSASASTLQRPPPAPLHDPHNHSDNNTNAADPNAFTTVELDHPSEPPSPTFSRAGSNVSNVSGLSDELNGSVDSVDLRRSFQETMDDFRRDQDASSDDESAAAPPPSPKKKQNYNPECTESEQPSVEEGPAASPILKKQRSEPNINMTRPHSKSVEFNIPPEVGPESTTVVAASPPRATPSTVFNSEVEATIKSQQLLLERRRANSLASENESLRLLIQSLKLRRGEEGEAGENATPSTILVIENLRQSNQLLQSKVEELANSNESLKAEKESKTQQLNELAGHHAAATDRMSGLADRIHELGLDVSEAEGKLKEKEALVETLKSSIEELGTELGNWKLKHAAVLADKTKAEEAMNAIKEEEKKNNKQRKIEAAKQRKELAQQKNVCASLEIELKELKKEMEGKGEEDKTLREENERLKSLLEKSKEKERSDAEKELISAKELSSANSKAENLTSTLQIEKTKANKLNGIIKELKKELGRSKTQLEGVQQQAAGVQIRTKEYYEGEIRGLREELESLGVHVRNAPSSPKAIASDADDEDMGAFSDTESLGGEENNSDEDNGGEGGDAENNSRTRTSSGGWGNFFGGKHKDKKERERRVSDALEALP
ncbi:hypothetical protein TrVE_jg13610 [Triparma verrucosa]|uniref:Uncharacterized protein n=1 Tax=Triparma verrucosa TaxID=1606542 RepID=A0A9W7ENP8_9STRA|nr:hypothetical protein TrVE_jg13610 [Triparma verrucosa]